MTIISKIYVPMSYKVNKMQIEDSSASAIQSPKSDGEDSSGADWQKVADSSLVVEDELKDIYVAALEESKFDSAELAEVHTLIEKAQVTLDPRSPMVSAVLRDMKQLQESNLVHPDSAIFVRQVRKFFH